MRGGLPPRAASADGAVALMLRRILARLGITWDVVSRREAAEELLSCPVQIVWRPLIVVDPPRGPQ